jgi:hypothetical protein
MTISANAESTPYLVLQHACRWFEPEDASLTVLLIRTIAIAGQYVTAMMQVHSQVLLCRCEVSAVAAHGHITTDGFAALSAAESSLRT